jgi:2-polyprenyl-3-methyl-5-hydroxy-6-metoxy-1,4-benzoquinol methylase
MNGYEAKGVEPSERFCKFAKECYGVEVELGYLDQSLNFKNEKFDVITLFHVMEHVSSPHKLLKDISNYLKEDGIVYIEVPNANACLLWVADIILRLCGKKWSSRLSPLHAPFHSMGYSSKSLKYILENNGFQIIYSGTFSGSVRGYDTGVRVNWVLNLFRDLAVKIVNFFPNRELAVVVASKSNINLDFDTVASFGDEWSRFDQSNLSQTESLKTFNEYFAVFPWHCLPKEAVGFDMGCGTGRWAKIMASRVGHLHCVEPSSAIDAAKGALQDFNNVSFHKTSLQDCPLTINSQDFGYSLGVLHHMPDTEAALRSCVSLLKPGAPFLVYLYYSFDNRSLGFKLVWRCSDMIRRVVSKLPANLKNIVTDIFALLLYYPLSRTCLILEHMGISVESIPLSYYRKHSFYTMRTDSRDRFGTPLEQRFTRKQIASMMMSAGLENVRFSDRAPYWCAVGIKK